MMMFNKTRIYSMSLLYEFSVHCVFCLEYFFVVVCIGQNLFCVSAAYLARNSLLLPVSYHKKLLDVNLFCFRVGGQFHLRFLRDEFVFGLVSSLFLRWLWSFTHQSFTHQFLVSSFLHGFGFCVELVGLCFGVYPSASHLSS
jgi:hypothetical protein